MAQAQQTQEPIRFSQGESGVPELFIYGEIGDGWWAEVGSRDFMNRLNECNGADILVRINTYGGEVVAGTAIYTMLATYKGKVTVQIDGYAMSMGSVIAMAGDEIHISEAGFFMLHSPWSYTFGNAEELRKEAAILDQMQDALINAYQARTGMDREELKAMLAEETWIDADEAIEKGFADKKITVQSNAKACFQSKLLERFNKAPDSLASFVLPDEPDTPQTDSVPEQTPPKASASTSSPSAVSVEDERKRCIAINKACSAAGLSHLAQGYIEKNYSEEDAKNLISEIKAGIDSAGKSGDEMELKPQDQQGEQGSKDTWAQALAKSPLKIKDKK